MYCPDPSTFIYVSATFTDKRIANLVGGNIDNFSLDVTSWVDYYAFGMLMPGRFWPGNTVPTGGYRFGFNGMEKDDEVKGITGSSYDFGARILDSRVGRWLVLDPLTAKFPHLSPYASMSNNPINRVDPSGKGDFHSQSGKKLGTDGINDGKLFVVMDKTAINIIRKNTRRDIFTSVESVQSSIVKLPSANVRYEIGKAVDRSNNPTDMSPTGPYTEGADIEGGFHEEGGIYGATNEGITKVVNAKPGKYANPKFDKEAKIDPFDPVNPLEKGTIVNVEGTFHIHSSGSIVETNIDDTSPGTINYGGITTTYSFQQEPSYLDIKIAKQGNPTGYSIVVGAGNEKVYIHDDTGIKAIFPLRAFKNIGNEKRKPEKGQQGQ